VKAREERDQKAVVLRSLRQGIKKSTQTIVSQLNRIRKQIRKKEMTNMMTIMKMNLKNY